MKSKLIGLSLVGMALALVFAFAIHGDAAAASTVGVKSLSTDNLVVLAGDEKIENKIEALEEKIDELEGLKDFDEEDMLIFVGDRDDRDDRRDRFERDFERERF